MTVCSGSPAGLPIVKVQPFLIPPISIPDSVIIIVIIVLLVIASLVRPCKGMLDLVTQRCDTVTIQLQSRDTVPVESKEGLFLVLSRLVLACVLCPVVCYFSCIGPIIVLHPSLWLWVMALLLLS